MIWSMNEIETLTKKAARGAGMSWGLAEEAGKATRRLQEWGLDGAAALADLLTATDGTARSDLLPLAVSGVWTARGGMLCPIAAGACLSDHAAVLAEHPVEMARVAQPMLLIPFAQTIAQQIGRVIDLRWDGVRVQIGTDAVHVAGTEPALCAAVATGVRCSPGQMVTGRKLAFTARAAITPVTAARLGTFAHRTYAPATDESRLAGAGAGLSDND
ncbi:MAG: DUF3726 domain-containing protein [Rhodobacteraceae bacterium]|jgi:hypothetical protein|nr:DUF3726 domain-containing protein [Paracoccaceae bacterium]